MIITGKKKFYQYTIRLDQNIKENDIRFNEKGLRPEAKYTRIHSETISTEWLTESELLGAFDSLYGNMDLQRILEKLQLIYDETISHLE